jgi:hypothetical protein
VLEKRDDFQIIIEPPEAPTEGINSKASKDEGQIFLINKRSKEDFLVSCRQNYITIDVQNTISDSIPLLV